MGYTLEQLQKMGAKPVSAPETPQKSFSLQDLQSSGAKPLSGGLALKSSDPFKYASPLQNIQRGDNSNLDVAKGALKGMGQVIRDTSGVDTNPVVKGMLANAPAFAKNIESAKKAIVPSNVAQEQGKQLSEVGANIIPAGGAAKTVAPILKKTGIEIAKIAATRSAQKTSKGILEAVTPKLTPTEYLEAAKAGQTLPKTLMKPARLSGAKFPDAQYALKAVLDVAKGLGKSAAEIVKPKADVTSNINRIGTAIRDYSTKVVAPFLKNNPVKTNFEDFIDYMKAVKPNAAIQASKEALPTFNRVRERVILSVYNTLKNAAKKAKDFGSVTDMNDFHKARKIIDDIIEEELGATTLADTARTGVKAAAKQLRAGVADFISDALRYPGQGEPLALFRTTVNGLRERGIEMGPQELRQLAKQLGLKPTGESIAKQWDDFMKNYQGLYKAQDALGTKVSAERTTTKIGDFFNSKPVQITKKGLIGTGILGAGAAGANAIVN